MGKRVFDHIGLKLVSFGLAFLVWFYVTSREKSEVTFSVPLRLNTVPQGMEVSWRSNKYVNVRVQGSPSEMKGLTPQEIQVQLELAGAQIGDNVYFLSDQNVRLPEGLGVASTTPSYVTLRMEKSHTKQVLVRPNLSGNLGEGYRLKKVDISPPTVEIRGTSSAVNAIERVETYPIDLSGIKENTTRAVSLRPPEKQVHFLQKRPYSATILVEGPPEEEATEDLQAESKSSDSNEDKP